MKTNRWTGKFLRCSRIRLNRMIITISESEQKQLCRRYNNENVYANTHCHTRALLAMTLHRQEKMEQSNRLASARRDDRSLHKQGDINISPWDKNEVSVVIEGLDDEDFDKVKMTQNGNIVRVSYRSRWDDGQDMFVLLSLCRHNLIWTLNTSGRWLGSKRGTNGKIDGSTSGGDIKLRNVFGGPVEVTTSGAILVQERLKATEVWRPPRRYPGWECEWLALCQTLPAGISRWRQSQISWCENGRRQYHHCNVGEEAHCLDVRRRYQGRQGFWQGNTQHGRRWYRIKRSERQC